MAEHVEHIKKTRRGGDTVETREVVRDRDPDLEAAHNQNVAARVVWFIAGIIIALLALRFILSLLGANRSNAFANFIYDTSHPFVAPFFGLFSYDNINYGVSRFEVYTLIAIVVYALIAYGLARLLTINRPEHSDY